MDKKVVKCYNKKGKSKNNINKKFMKGMNNYEKR